MLKKTINYSINQWKQYTIYFDLKHNLCGELTINNIVKFHLLSLYSTATQNTWRRGLALGNAPDARILRWRYQHVGILEPTQNVKFASPPTQNVKFALPLTPTPDASPWNIGGVGSPTQDFHVGHVHFMLFMSISIASGTQRKLVFQWNVGFSVSDYLPLTLPLSTPRCPRRCSASVGCRTSSRETPCP